jgi:hypothetical protein
MERKQFISAAIAGAGALVAAGAVLADTTEPTQTNAPGGTDPCQPGGQRFGTGPRTMSSPDPNAILEHADRNLGHLITMLERDPNDYSGHKEQAISYLQQALGQVQAALQAAGVNNQQGALQSGL